MDDLTKRRLMAAGKIAFGVARVAGGVATATGHGAIGSYMKSHHMMRYAARFGAQGVKQGYKACQEGLEDWKNA